MEKREVSIAARDARLEATLVLPENANRIVAFSHGSGSSRFSPRNNFVADKLNDAGFATLLIDLLTPEEDRDYAMRFDIELLAQRLVDATSWLGSQTDTRRIRIGYFGASTGAAAALKAASVLGTGIGAIVSRGGRPDLANTEELSKVVSPTLLIVGGLDEAVIELNRQAFGRLTCKKAIKIVPGASHLFEEPGKLETVAIEAKNWFSQNLS